MNIAQLDQALKAVCPIYGVSIGVMDDPATWRIDFKDEATEEQKSAALEVMKGVSVIEPFEMQEPTKAELQTQVAVLSAQIAALP